MLSIKRLCIHTNTRRFELLLCSPMDTLADGDYQMKRPWTTIRVSQQMRDALSHYCRERNLYLSRSLEKIIKDFLDAPPQFPTPSLEDPAGLVPAGVSNPSLPSHPDRGNPAAGLCPRTVRRPPPPESPPPRRGRKP